MRVELFTLCDGAYNYNGKLTIVGALTTISPETLPCRIKLGVAMRIQVDSKNKGTNNMAINFLDPDGNRLPVDLTVELDVKHTLDTVRPHTSQAGKVVELDVKHTPDTVSYITFAADLQGFPIEKEGSHKVVIVIDGETLATYSYNVKKRG